MLKFTFLVGVGGFIGSVSRYLLSIFVQQHALTSFPIGTFTVNILGSFLVGLIYGLTDRGGLFSGELRMFLAVGFCGGFTTFSTFSNDSLSLLKDGQFLLFLIYAASSLILGLIAVYLGYLITKLI